SRSSARTQGNNLDGPSAGQPKLNHCRKTRIVHENAAIYIILTLKESGRKIGRSCRARPGYFLDGIVIDFIPTCLGSDKYMGSIVTEAESRNQNFGVPYTLADHPSLEVISQSFL